MDASVGNQAFESQTSDLPPNRIERGHRDRLRSVIDDQIDTGDGLQRPDVAPLPADDAALHVV